MLHRFHPVEKHDRALAVACSALRTVRKAEWDESAHPRAENGQFGQGGGGTGGGSGDKKTSRLGPASPFFGPFDSGQPLKEVSDRAKAKSQRLDKEGGDRSEHNDARAMHRDATLAAERDGNKKLADHHFAESLRHDALAASLTKDFYQRTPAKKAVGSAT